ncbi:MAG TPA: hypothetical protein VL769_02885 [Acidimicrobiia bacterium]|jgi:hypothetical protein|nr:hypothetical protein [Acidimicrobiia bacterium]
MTMGSGARRCALGGIVGPTAFVVAWSIGSVAASHYSAIDDAISRLAEVGAPTRALMTAGFVVYGAGFLISSLVGAGAGISLLATTATDLNGLFQRIGLTIVDVWIVATAVAILRMRLTPRRPDNGRGKLAGC